MTCRRGAQLPHLASGRNLRVHDTPRHAAAGPGPRDQPQRGHHRQPVGKDHGKGAQRLRRGQEGEGTQTPYRSRYPGTAAGGVHPADIQDRDGARLVLRRLMGRFPRLQLIWADGAYGAGVGPDGGRLDPGTGAPSSTATHLPGAAPAGGTHLRLAEPAAAIEQGLRGIVRNHETWIYISMTGLMLRRLARLPSF